MPGLWIEGSSLFCSWFTRGQSFEPSQALDCFWIEGNKQMYQSLLHQLHWLCHLSLSVKLSFHWQHCLTRQPCVYVLFTTVAKYFLDFVQMKEDQAVLFLTYCDFKSKLFQSTVIHGVEWMFIGKTIFVQKIILRKLASV